MSYASPSPLGFVGDRVGGKVLFVTGASSGIGAAAVRRFTAEGALVAAAARRADRLQTLARQLRDDGKEVIPVACDVTNEDSIAAAVEETVRSSADWTARSTTPGREARSGPCTRSRPRNSTPS
jgi:A-factor type gamma-butyrolactone 1'-reductase (1S-forming)